MRNLELSPGPYDDCCLCWEMALRLCISGVGLVGRSRSSSGGMCCLGLSFRYGVPGRWYSGTRPTRRDVVFAWENVILHALGIDQICFSVRAHEEEEQQQQQIRPSASCVRKRFGWGGGMSRGNPARSST